MKWISYIYRKEVHKALDTPFSVFVLLNCISILPNIGLFSMRIKRLYLSIAPMRLTVIINWMPGYPRMNLNVMKRYFNAYAFGMHFQARTLDEANKDAERFRRLSMRIKELEAQLAAK